MSRKFLYLKSGLAVIVILGVVGGIGTRRAEAQQPQLKRPQETPEEKPPEPVRKKKEKGPRAVGLLQLSSNGKATLIPIAILIDGKFRDASVYKADPVPMALEGGTVYEAEEAGESQGLFTIRGALHSKSPGSPSPWVGSGSFVAHGAEAAQTTHKAENVPVGMDSSGDEPPRLVRGTDSKVATAGGTGASKQGGTNGSAPSGSAPSGSAQPGSAPPAASQTGSAPSGTTSGQGGAAKAGGQAGADKSGEQGERRQASGPTAKSGEPAGSASQSDQSNYYRPTLRRGKPTESAPEEEVTSTAVGRPMAETTGAAGSGGGTAAVKVIPAISDAGGPDPRPYKFYWKEGEEDERRKQMLTLAEDELRAYVNARAKGAIAAKPAGTKAGVPARKPAAKPAQAVLENVEFRAFDVWANNQPVMILSAEGHVTLAETRAGAPESYSITLVARTDIYGNLRKLYSGVTDKFHLDVTPKLELIDAVDADGDGRGELLFRETTDAGSGYVIYRATADKLWKMFDSLGE